MSQGQPVSLGFPFLLVLKEKLYGSIAQSFFRPDILPDAQPTVSKHWHRPVAFPYPFFIQYWTPGGRDIVRFTLANCGNGLDYPMGCICVWCWYIVPKWLTSWSCLSRVRVIIKDSYFLLDMGLYPLIKTKTIAGGGVTDPLSFNHKS